MPIDPQQTIYYKRARFTTRLPAGYRYDRSHFWLAEVEAGTYKVGLTRFATRMLGDLVEFRLPVTAGQPVELGQTIGSIEGFKAVSDLFCVADGTFLGGNAELEQDPTLLDRDPYDRGWLYQVRGQPNPSAMDVAGYVQFLDTVIDRMLGEQQQRSKQC